MLKDILLNKFFLAGGMCFFGASVHVANQRLLLAKKGTPASTGDCIALYITALFAGMVFGLIAIMTSDNIIHFFLATSTGSFLGIAGLTKITDRIVDMLVKKV